MTAPLTICVIVASRGRPDFLAALGERLNAQERPPDKLIYSVVEPSDAPEPTSNGVPSEVLTGPPGLTKQRNRGLAQSREFDIIAFFDDDFVPSKFAISSILETFATYPSVGGLTGVLLADGIHGPGFSIEEAFRMVDEADAATERKSPHILLELRGLYGCNMAFRSSAIEGLWFDERLPLYGWQEDIDFSSQVPLTTVKIDSVLGVHCGTKSGRELNGKRLGYSQIVNPAYLVKKGTMRPKLALRHVCRNLLANHLKSFAPEPWIDRRGRMRGNWAAVADLLRGRLDPERILEM